MAEKQEYPKQYWTVNPFPDTKIWMDDEADNERKAAGNYFDTREDAADFAAFVRAHIPELFCRYSAKATKSGIPDIGARVYRKTTKRY